MNELMIIQGSLRFHKKIRPITAIYAIQNLINLYDFFTRL
jgi:hypothetical protein